MTATQPAPYEDPVLHPVEVAGRRAIRHILDFKDNNVDRYLPPGVGDSLRSMILNELNRVVQVALNECQSGVVLNDEYLERLTAIYDKVCGVPSA